MGWGGWGDKESNEEAKNDMYEWRQRHSSELKCCEKYKGWFGCSSNCPYYGNCSIKSES